VTAKLLEISAACSVLGGAGAVACNAFQLAGPLLWLLKYPFLHEGSECGPNNQRFGAHTHKYEPLDRNMPDIEEEIVLLKVS